jgi:hypothetical protein
MTLCLKGKWIYLTVHLTISPLRHCCGKSILQPSFTSTRIPLDRHKAPESISISPAKILSSTCRSFTTQKTTAWMSENSPALGLVRSLTPLLSQITQSRLSAVIVRLQYLHQTGGLLIFDVLVLAAHRLRSKIQVNEAPGRHP